IGNRTMVVSTVPFVPGSSLAISEQPVNDTICSGFTASFDLTATGSGLTYQWQQNAGSGWTNVSNGGFFQGVTTDSLTVVFTNASYNGRQFRALIADDCGSLDTSITATLYVNNVVANAVLSQIHVCEGQSFSLGGFDPSIPANQINQWQINTGSGFIDLEDDSQYSGTNTSFLLVNNATVAQHDGALIRVYYTAPGCDTIFSGSALISIYSADPIVNDTACIGQSASFTVNVTGIDSFQWQIFNGTWTNLSNSAPYSGVNSSTLNISSVGPAQAGSQFRVLFFRNGVNQPLCIENNLSPSNQATLISPAPLAITSQSGPISLCTNQNGQLYVQANQTLTSIQWQVDLGSGTFVNATNGVDYSGVTNDTLTIISAALIENGDRFRVIITNDCGETLTSPIINLSVFPAPSVSISALQTVCQGNNVFVSISSVQGSNISYQWQVDSSGVWQNLTNAGGYSNTNGSFLGFAGSIVVPSISTDRYRVIINTDCGPDTSGSLQLDVIPNVQITQQPQNAVVCLGDNATINVIANNAASYQWQSNASGTFTNLSNNAIFSGVTSSTLTITNVGVAQTGILYRVILTGTFPCSNLTSTTASISLTGPTSITAQSVDISACQGVDTFLYVSTSSGATGFQWQVNSGSGFVNLTNGGDYSGVTNDTLFISPIQTSMDGNQYQCIVSSTCGANPISTPITLSIGANLTVLNQPDSLLVCVGENAPFVMEASGSGLTYQWQQFNGSTWSNINNGAFFQGTTSDSLTVLNVQAAYNGRLYRCLLSDACGNNIISDTALLNVNNVIPVLISGNFSICENSSGSIGDASAPTSQSYQWQINDNQGGGWVNLVNNPTFSGVNTGFLLISNAPLSLDGDSVRLITFNPACDSLSSATLLNIDTIAVLTAAPTNQNVCLGSPVQFGATATGSPSYQWQIFNGSAFVNLIDGAVYQGATTYFEHTFCNKLLNATYNCKY
ncbi:MAG: immunoglobulin domain-containing protein, partial [Chitinophagales bacterium]